MARTIKRTKAESSQTVTETGDLRIEYRSLDSLIPYARNPRTHSEEQVAQIAVSIKEFGFTNPILLDGENGVIAGHGRLAAARLLGLKTVPCIELSHLSEAQKRAYIIALCGVRSYVASVDQPSSLRRTMFPEHHIRRRFTMNLGMPSERHLCAKA